MAAKSKQTEGTGEGKERDVLSTGFGDAVREFRKNNELKLSQTELSARAGLSSNAVGDLERGERVIKGEEAKSICKVLGVPLRSFMMRAVELQLEAMGEPQVTAKPEKSAAGKVTELFLMMGLRGKTPDEIIAILHKVMLLTEPLEPEEE